MIRWRSRDRLGGEALYLLAAVLIGSGLALAQTVVWTFLSPASASLFFVVASQSVVVLVFIVLCVVGWQPRIVVTIGRDTLEIESGDTHLRIPKSSIVRLSYVDSQVYYRHYRRYERTLAYVNRIPAKLLLLELEDRPLVLGLAMEESERLEKALAIPSDSYHVA